MEFLNKKLCLLENNNSKKDSTSNIGEYEFKERFGGNISIRDKNTRFWNHSSEQGGSSDVLDTAINPPRITYPEAVYMRWEEGDREKVEKTTIAFN